jgi:hypothetical protein
VCFPIEDTFGTSDIEMVVRKMTENKAMEGIIIIKNKITAMAKKVFN